MVSQDELKELMHYEPSTGIFTRLKSNNGFVKIGDEVGWTAGHGHTDLCYRSTEINRRKYLLHRLAFLYMTGKMPDLHIDHIDHNGLNNRWANLRQVTRSENLRNSRLSVNNKSGNKGVSFYIRNGKWRAAINADGKKRHLGYFIDKQDAINARKEAERKYYEVDQAKRYSY